MAMKSLVEWTDREFAELQEAVQQLDGNPKDRRAVQRRKYSFVQAIAPFDGVELPKRTMFCPIRFHDLSTTGVSFVLPVPPPFEYLVVALGKPPQLLYLAARVVRSIRCFQSRGDFLVGCRFVRKVVVAP